MSDVSEESWSKLRTNFSAKLIPFGKTHCNSKYPSSEVESFSFGCALLQNSLRENEDEGIETESPVIKKIKITLYYYFQYHVNLLSL